MLQAYEILCSLIICPTMLWHIYIIYTWLTKLLNICVLSEASKPPIADAKKPKENYDDIYFDSSDSETEESQPTDGNIRNVGKKVCKLSNDELFYDPGLDAEDERWVNRQRMAYHNG